MNDHVAFVACPAQNGLCMVSLGIFIFFCSRGLPGLPAVSMKILGQTTLDSVPDGSAKVTWSCL